MAMTAIEPGRLGVDVRRECLGYVLVKVEGPAFANVLAFILDKVAGKLEPIHFRFRNGLQQSDGALIVAGGS